MRLVLARLAFVLCLATSASAQQADVERVIRDQMDAFLADDFATAFTYASPAIREIFGDSGRFGAMVREGYPMVWRPADVQFLDFEDRGGAVVQRVLVRDQSGALHVIAYHMVPTDGGWQINGVQVLDGDGLSA